MRYYESFFNINNNKELLNDTIHAFIELLHLNLLRKFEGGDSLVCCLAPLKNLDSYNITSESMSP